MVRKSHILFFTFLVVMALVGISYAGVSYVSPEGWIKISSEPESEGGSYMSPDKMATVTINISKPIGQIVYQATLTSFRNQLKPVSEETITFLGVPCHVFNVREPGQKGMTIGKKVYNFLKGDQQNVIIYQAYMGPFEEHLAEFEKSLSSFEVTK